MHDTISFELAQRPAVFLVSSEFEEAVEVQAKALGLPEVRRVIVPHPIQGTTAEEIRAKADGVLDKVISALTA